MPIGGIGMKSDIKIEKKLNKDDINLRINKVIGQLNGIKKMIETETECIDILTQISSAKGALNSLNKIVFENYLSHCFNKNYKKDENKTINEFINIIERLIK